MAHFLRAFTGQPHQQIRQRGHWLDLLELQYKKSAPGGKHISIICRVMLTNVTKEYKRQGRQTHLCKEGGIRSLSKPGWLTTKSSSPANRPEKDAKRWWRIACFTTINGNSGQVKGATKVFSYLLRLWLCGFNHPIQKPLGKRQRYPQTERKARQILF